MINDKLKELATAFRFKDASKIPYFIDIIGVQSEDDGNEMNVPLLTVSQARRKATGVDSFTKVVEFVEGNSKYIAVVINEYDSVDDEATPINSQRIELESRQKSQPKKSNTMKRKTKEDLEKENAELREQLQKFSPSMSGNLLGVTNQIMEMVGVQGGLGAVAQNAAMLMTTQDKLEDSKLTIQELKEEIRNLNNKLETKNNEIEKFKDDLRKVKEDARDEKHKYEMQVESLQSKLGIGSMFTTGLMGFMVKNSPKLAGFFGECEQEAQAQMQGSVQAQAEDSLLANVPEQNAELIRSVVEYLKSLDEINLQLVVSCIQYCSQSTDNIKILAKFVQSKNQN